MPAVTTGAGDLLGPDLWAPIAGPDLLGPDLLGHAQAVRSDCRYRVGRKHIVAASAEAGTIRVLRRPGCAR